MGREGLLTSRKLAATAAAAAAVVAAAGLPGSAGSHQSDENAAPDAVLRASDRIADVGTTIALDASRSRDPGGRIVHFLWDLDDDGVYERRTGSARVRHTLRDAGRKRLAVAVVDDDGAHAIDRTSVTVVRPAAARRSKARGGRAAKSAAAKRARAATASKQAAKRDGASDPKPDAKAAPTVRAAQESPSIQIEDFKYKPPSISVKAGTTVTWTNQDSSVHTATAVDGSFDTGNLEKGESGSYTFENPGTYDYYCIPHKDFMKASVTVTGSGDDASTDSSDDSADGSGGSGDSGGAAGDDSGGDSNLPHTGLQIASVVLAGLLLLGAGLAVRRRVRAS